MLIIVLLGLIGVGLMLAGFYGLLIDSGIISIYLMVGGLFTGLAAPIVYNAQNERYAAKIRAERAQREADHDEKMAEVRLQLQSGSLPVSAEKFYRLCEKNNIQKLDNDFSYTKAKQQLRLCIIDSAIATLSRLLKTSLDISSDTLDDILKLLNDPTPMSAAEREERNTKLRRRGIPVEMEFSDEECSYYFQKERMEQLLLEGKQIVDDVNRAELEAKKTPKDVTPSETEQVFLQRVSQISALYGNEKRVKMLDDLGLDLAIRIAKLKEGEEALKTLGMIYLDQQKKEGDWAIAGGLAQGLAGSAAGYMAASQVIENNREIQRHNAAMRNASLNILSGIPSAVSNREELQKERELVCQKRAEAQEKIVLSSPAASEIWNHLHAGKYEIKKAKSGVLKIALPVCIKTPLALDVPANVATVIDGTLQAEVLFEGKSVGVVNFPLPLYGILTNMTAEVTLDGMLDRSVEFNGEYTLKMLDSHNLWVMEA